MFYNRNPPIGPRIEGGVLVCYRCRRVQEEEGGPASCMIPQWFKRESQKSMCTLELGLFCGYIANISRCHISHSLGRPGYIAIYRNHSAHFYELGMNYEVFCSIWQFAVYCNALLNYFIVCDFYKVVIWLWFFPTSFSLSFNFGTDSCPHPDTVCELWPFTFFYSSNQHIILNLRNETGQWKHNNYEQS